VQKSTSYAIVLFAGIYLCPRFDEDFFCVYRIVEYVKLIDIDEFFVYLKRILDYNYRFNNETNYYIREFC
jgi:hypothetical protein